MRLEFSTKVKMAALERANGHCEKCGHSLTFAKHAFDHIIPDALGGKPTLDNCQVICSLCHYDKTKGDVRAIAKNKRIRAKHQGIRKKATMPGSRGTRFKKRMDGTTVLR